MAYEAKIIADSISPDDIRLTTMQVTFPRIVLAEFNTHRMLSRNSASSRAIPVEKMIERVRKDPFVPIYWGKNQKGMQADVELTASEIANAEHIWLDKRNHAVNAALGMIEIGVHKQIANRLLEPWLWHTVVVTATEWENFFNLRCHKDAQPEIRRVAEMMRGIYQAGSPQRLDYGQWHLPYVGQHDAMDAISSAVGTMGRPELVAKEGLKWARISSARCARVSYLTQEGRRDIEEDIKLADRLHTSGHMSPFEHAAKPRADDWKEHRMGFLGNFRGWTQYRKLLPSEAVFGGEI